MRVVSPDESGDGIVSTPRFETEGSRPGSCSDSRAPSCAWKPWGPEDPGGEGPGFAGDAAFGSANGRRDRRSAGGRKSKSVAGIHLNGSSASGPSRVFVTAMTTDVSPASVAMKHPDSEKSRSFAISEEVVRDGPQLPRRDGPEIRGRRRLHGHGLLDRRCRRIARTAGTLIVVVMPQSTSAGADVVEDRRPPVCFGQDQAMQRARFDLPSLEEATRKRGRELARAARVLLEPRLRTRIIKVMRHHDPIRTIVFPVTHE